jgi:hypothetical protein
MDGTVARLESSERSSISAGSAPVHLGDPLRADGESPDVLPSAAGAGRSSVKQGDGGRKISLHEAAA